MPSAVNETINNVNEPTENELFQRIDEEQIYLDEDDMESLETNTNDSDTWSNHEHENDNIFSDNDEINSSPSPTMAAASQSVPDVMHIGSSDAASGRIRGRNVARRGRRGPHPKIGHSSRTPYPMYSNTPFGHGLTFNGFAKNLELETILDCIVHSDDTLLFRVKWRNDGNRVRKIESSLLRTYSPQMLMDFYEKKMFEYYRS